MDRTPQLPDGLVRPGLAAVDPYEPGRPIESVQRETGIRRVVKLASNEGPLPPFPAAQRAIAEAAAGQRLYPDPGAWALRDALERHTGVPAGQILPGAGIDSLIKQIAQVALDPGDELAMGWPSFLSWRQQALVQGAVPVTVPLAPSGAYDLDALLAAVTPRTKLVVVVSPNNPTGGTVAVADLIDFLERLPCHALPLLDEAYFEYLPAGSHDGAALVREGRPLGVLRTFSKAFGLAGLRAGYLMAPAPLLAEILRVRSVFDINGIAQAAATASLAAAASELPVRIAMNAAERRRMADGLRVLGLDPLPSDANFVLVDLGSAERARAAYEALLAHGVIVRPARAFGAPSALRLTNGLPEDTPVLLEAMAGVIGGLPAAA
jgi:histidinol-phosphate aminotransferase